MNIDRSDQNTFTVYFETLYEFRDEFDKNISHKAFEIPYIDGLDINTELIINFVIIEAKRTYTVKARLIYIPEDKNLLLGTEIISNDIVELIDRDLKSSDKWIFNDSEFTKEAHDDSISMLHKIKNLPLSDKIKLAIKGGKDVRKILLVENHPKITLFLLKNPRVSSEEISMIARNPMNSSEILDIIGKNSSWMQDKTIRFNLLKNPKTQVDVIRKYIAALTPQELKGLASSPSVKESVARMAKGLLSGRAKSV